MGRVQLSTDTYIRPWLKNVACSTSLTFAWSVLRVSRVRIYFAHSCFYTKLEKYQPTFSFATALYACSYKCMHACHHTSKMQLASKTNQGIAYIPHQLPSCRTYLCFFNGLSSMFWTDRITAKKISKKHFYKNSTVSENMSCRVVS